MDDCHGQHFHHHVNHIIMSTTNHQVVGKWNSSGTREFTGESTLGRETMFFSGKVASVVAEGGSLFPWFRTSRWESRRQKAHRTVARARFPFQYSEKLTASEHFWKM